MSKIFGKKRAIIIDPRHPSKPGFVRVEIPGVSYSRDEDDYPWAEIMFHGANGFNEGAYIPYKKGMSVWVEFIEGDRNYPLVVGSCMASPDGLLDAPHDSFGAVKSLDGLHEFPIGEDGVAEPDYQETKASVEGRAVAFTKEGFNFRIQNGALTITHLKTGGRFEFSEGGFLDLFTKENGFIRAQRKLKIIAGELILKASKSIDFEFPSLQQNIKKWNLETTGFGVISTGAIKLSGKAVQLLSDSDMILTSQGKIDFAANGAILLNIAQNLVTATDKAFGVQLHQAGFPLASAGISSLGDITAENLAGGKTGVDKTGLLIFENSVSSLKDKLVDHLSKMDEIATEVGDLIINTGTGLGSVNATSKSKIMKIKASLAQAKAQLYLLMK